MNTERKSIEVLDDEHSYEKVVLQALARNDQVELETLCDTQGASHSYPVILVRSKSTDTAKPTVCITAGMHGDEPAAVHAAIRFVNTEIHKYADVYNIVVVPCMNPSGFDANTHNTALGLNLNSHFDTQSDDAVVQALEQQLRSVAPSTVLALDLHEDSSEERLGCYVYEVLSNKTNSIAHSILQTLSPTDVYTDPIVHMDLTEPNDNGVITYSTDQSEELSTTLNGYLKKYGATHVMTVETPTVWPLEKRIQIHLELIRRSLDLADQKMD